MDASHLPTGVQINDMSVPDWFIFARDHFDEDHLHVHDVFPSENTGDWEVIDAPAPTLVAWQTGADADINTLETEMDAAEVRLNTLETEMDAAEVRLTTGETSATDHGGGAIRPAPGSGRYCYR